jgi:hypothetical protein
MMKALSFNQSQGISYEVTPIIWVDFFELTIFTMGPSNVYNTPVIQYNFY